MGQISYLDDLEQRQHEDAIERLCQQHPEQSDLVERTYLEALRPLINQASIRTYLSILVSRKVEASMGKS